MRNPLLVVALAAVFATAAAAVEVGQAAPNFKFDKSWNALEGASQLDDYRGKLVLLEVWATWWKPCVAGVPHLKELNQKYRERGLEIVAVSDEAVAKIEGFIKQHEASYGVVNAKGVLQLYGGRGYPSAWVVDAEGKVIWSGHPSKVTDAEVDEWLKNLLPTKVDRELASELKGAVKAFDGAEYGKALTAAREAAKAEGASEQVKADAAYLESLVQKHINAANTKRDAAKAAGDLVKAAGVLEKAAEQFKGSDYGTECATARAELVKSKEYKDCVEAAEQLAKLKPKLEDMKSASAHKALKKIADKYPATPAGKEAAELLKSYQE